MLPDCIEVLKDKGQSRCKADLLMQTPGKSKVSNDRGTPCLTEHGMLVTSHISCRFEAVHLCSCCPPNLVLLLVSSTGRFASASTCTPICWVVRLSRRPLKLDSYSCKAIVLDSGFCCCSSTCIGVCHKVQISLLMQIHGN